MNIPARDEDGNQLTLSIRSHSLTDVKIEVVEQSQATVADLTWLAGVLSVTPRRRLSLDQLSVDLPPGSDIAEFAWNETRVFVDLEALVRCARAVLTVHRKQRAAECDQKFVPDWTI